MFTPPPVKPVPAVTPVMSPRLPSVVTSTQVKLPEPSVERTCPDVPSPLGNIQVVSVVTVDGDLMPTKLEWLTTQQPHLVIKATPPALTHRDQISLKRPHAT